MVSAASRSRADEYVALNAQLTELSVHLVASELETILGNEMLAVALNRHIRTVTRWVKGESIPPLEVERSLRDVHHIAALLQTVKPDVGVRAWFISMNPLLGDTAPVDALANGLTKRVMKAARKLVQFSEMNN